MLEGDGGIILLNGRIFQKRLGLHDIEEGWGIPDDFVPWSEVRSQKIMVLGFGGFPFVIERDSQVVMGFRQVRLRGRGLLESLGSPAPIAC